MRLRSRLVAATLVTIVIGSAACSRPNANEPAVRADSQAPLNVRTPVPPFVMSALRRACFDCHSDETHWPWYAALPVASHLIERDVTRGRGQVNFSRWTQYNPFDRADLLDKICEMASTGKMPPRQYRMMHFEAWLSMKDVAALCNWSQQEATRLVQGEHDADQ
jgi:cytochrome c